MLARFSRRLTLTLVGTLVLVIAIASPAAAPPGDLDSTFDGDGKVTTDFAGSYDQAFGMAIQGDGKIVAAGIAVVSGIDDFALARYQSQGTADLALTKTDPPGRAPTGRDMTYTLTVTNNGPDAASGVTVTDQLPPSVTFVSATPSQGSCSESGGIVTCSLGTLGNGATATVNIVVKPTVAGTITNTASVTAFDQDPNQGNNADSENTSVCRITSRRSSIPCGSAPPTTFSFAAAGDHGANTRTDASLAALNTSGASFYLALGDLDYDETATDEAWCDYVKARLPNLGPSFPFQLVSGNHEEQGGVDGYILNHAACLPDRLGSTIGPNSQYGAEYYFDYPAGAPLVRVIMIPAHLMVENVHYDYAPGSSHRQWLVDAIDDARASGVGWVVVGMHHQCLTAGEKLCSMSDLMNLLIEKKVDLILQAHDHNYQRSKQLAHNPSTCPSVPINAYDPDCVVDDGADGAYPKGAGTVTVIDGTFGRGLYAINPSDPEAPYFVRMDSTTWGFTKYTVTPDRIDARFVNSIGSFTDAFSIVSGGTPEVDSSPPTAPSGLTATPSSGTRLDLSWTASTDNAGVDHYSIFRGGAHLP